MEHKKLFTISLRNPSPAAQETVVVLADDEDEALQITMTCGGVTGIRQWPGCVKAVGANRVTSRLPGAEPTVRRSISLAVGSDDFRLPDDG